MTSSSWYIVKRSYRVADVVYVQADSAEEATAKVEAGEYEYDHVTDLAPVGPTRLNKPTRKKFKDLPFDVRHYAEFGFLP